MSVKRVLNKRHKAQPTQDPHESAQITQQSPISSPNSHARNQQAPQNTTSNYNPQRQKQYEEYAHYSEYNPSCFQFSNNYIPSSLALYNKYRAPMSCFINPINPDLEHTPQSANTIPRCASCRAYMNYYNQTSQKGYRCFLCGRDNHYDFQYSPDNQGIELQSPSYLIDGPQGVYQAVPPELTYIFLIDISRQAAQCQMLNYVVSVMRDVLAREDLDDTIIHFYTFDDTLHEYDFQGEQPERTVLDFSLKPQARTPQNFLSQIRDKLFCLLDSLEEVSEKNSRQGSRFFQAFEHVYQSTKQSGGKIFVFQSNEGLAGENFTNQNFKWTTNPQELNSKLKSQLQSKNKLFFNRFVQPMLNDNISASFFIFGRGNKNIKVFSDTCKLTNSQLFLYSKDQTQDLTRFYYDFYHLLSANYYIDARVEFMISAGWYYTAVYGNLYRLKEFITFKYCHFQEAKRICAVFLPQEGFLSLPYFSIQIATNYVYGRKHYLSVNTSVLPFTTSIDRLFENINVPATSATVFKIYMSTLRLQDLASCKNKYIKHVASIWKAIQQFYKGNYPPELRNMILSFLGFLKNYHSQIDMVYNSPIFERLIAQRNLLQCANHSDTNAPFSPYLFDLTTIDSTRCQPDNFIYPDPCQLRFSSVKQGLFLMDTGQAMYLYISRQCAPGYIFSLFGKQKLVKNETVTEDTITNQNNEFSQQFLQLLRVLRESKTYGWVPLYVVRCGQNSEHQKNFYLHFYEQKYDQFKSYKLTFQEFVGMLAKQY